MPKSWLGDRSSSGVALYRYNTASSQWDPLPTQQVSEDVEYVYYSAESPRLSFFAIASVIPAVSVVWWIVIGVAVIAAAAVVVFEFRRRRKKLAEKPPVEEVPEEIVEELAPLLPTAPPAATRNLRITSYDSSLKRGETCNVRVLLEYQGPRLTGTLRVAVGQIGRAEIDEKAYDSKRVTVPETMSWKTYFVNMSIDTEALSEGTYDLYAKVQEAFPEITSSYLRNVITIEEEPAEKPPEETGG
ncbi:hypothetical protein ES703_121598 [subsurface metagenome]